MASAERGLSTTVQNNELQFDESIKRDMLNGIKTLAVELAGGKFNEETQLSIRNGIFSGILDAMHEMFDETFIIHERVPQPAPTRPKREIDIYLASLGMDNPDLRSYIASMDDELSCDFIEKLMLLSKFPADVVRPLVDKALEEAQRKNQEEDKDLERELKERNAENYLIIRGDPVYFKKKKKKVKKSLRSLSSEIDYICTQLEIDPDMIDDDPDFMTNQSYDPDFPAEHDDLKNKELGEYTKWELGNYMTWQLNQKDILVNKYKIDLVEKKDANSAKIYEDEKKLCDQLRQNLELHIENMKKDYDTLREKVKEYNMIDENEPKQKKKTQDCHSCTFTSFYRITAYNGRPYYRCE